jgi:L-cysteine S-thiosulfotransferase
MKAWAFVLPALAGLAAMAQPLPDGRRSGFEYMGESTRAMQRDDALNPGMLWVLEGEAAWSQPVGAEGRSCAGCHGDARRSMRGVAARYPAFDAALQRPVDLRQRIAGCRQKLQTQAIPPGDEPQALALEAYVAFQSRGLPMAPPDDPRLEPARERGRALFQQRLGQLDLACSDCHDAHAGRRLGGSPIPQAHPTGYPIYRLEWQGLGSLQRRLRACLSGVRAAPFAWGASEWIELELFLAWRARGMPMESPGVRP